MASTQPGDVDVGATRAQKPRASCPQAEATAFLWDPWPPCNLLLLREFGGACFFSPTLMNPCYRDVSKGHGLCVMLLTPSSPALETSPSCKLACQAGTSHLRCEHCLVCKLLRASFSTICFEKENVCMIICSRGSVTVYLCCIQSVWKCVLP